MSMREVAPRASAGWRRVKPKTAAPPSERPPSAAMPLPGTWPAGKPGYARTVGAYSCRPRTLSPLPVHLVSQGRAVGPCRRWQPTGKAGRGASLCHLERRTESGKGNALVWESSISYQVTRLWASPRS